MRQTIRIRYEQLEKKHEYYIQLKDGIGELEAQIEELRKEIIELKQQRDALELGNLFQYQELTRTYSGDF